MVGGGALTSTIPFMKRWTLRTLPALTQVSCALQSPAAWLLAQGLLPPPPQASTQIPWCSFCHKVALMEAEEWLPDAAQAGGPGPRGRPGPTLPSSLLRNGQGCSTVPMEGSPSGIWGPGGEKGLSSSALCFPTLTALLPGLTPPRAPCDPRPSGPSHPAGW